MDIVRNGGLVPLAKLITSNKLPLILSAVACIRNISIHPLNESPIIDSGFLPHLVKLLDRTEDEVLSHTVITMRNVSLYRMLTDDGSWQLRRIGINER
jgi:vacuolar protein 8